MKVITTNMSDFETSKVATLTTTYNILEKHFGKPKVENKYDKVKYIWYVDLGVCKVSIYPWFGENPKGDREYGFSIGGYCDFLIENKSNHVVFKKMSEENKLKVLETLKKLGKIEGVF